VIGCDNVKKEVQSNLDGSKGKGYIFAGPPGLGKTLMARAIAGETKLPFIEIFANELQGANIPTVFNKVAKTHRPCIILMDEGDQIYSSFSNHLLRKLDGFDSSDMKGVVVIITTTSKSLYESNSGSIQRSGRLKTFVFEAPDIHQRTKYLSKSFSGSELDTLVSQTAGFSYADLTEVIKDPTQIKPVNEIRFGRFSVNSELSTEKEKRIAYHEIGHFLISLVLKHSPKPVSISIVRNGPIGGHTIQKTENDEIKTFSELVAQVAVYLASSIFEEKFLKEYSTACSHDFTAIEKIASLMKDNWMITSDRESYILQMIRKKIIEIINQIGIDRIETFQKRLLIEKSLSTGQITEFDEFIDKFELNIAPDREYPKVLLRIRSSVF
jgi:cell division protease FtsH